MKITPLNGDPEETVDLPVPTHATKAQTKLILKQSYEALERLDKYDAPDTPVENYLDKQTGKYVRMLEGLVDVAAGLGNVETTSVILFGLLKLTKLGRQKAEITMTGVTKLRDEGDMTELSDDELEKLAAKVKLRA